MSDEMHDDTEKTPARAMGDHHGRRYGPPPAPTLSRDETHQYEPVTFSMYEGRGIRVHTYDQFPDYWLAYTDLHALPFETSGHRRVPFAEMFESEARAALRAMIGDRPDLIAPLRRPIDEADA